MRAQIRLILSTIALTGLIWVYADRSDHRDLAVNVIVALRPPPDVVVEVRGTAGNNQNEVQVPITVRGPKAAIDRLERAQWAEGPVLRRPIDLPDDLDTRRVHRLEMREYLEDWPELQNRGLELVDVGKPTVEFTVDRYVRLEIEVQVDPGTFAEALVGEPKVEPKAVHARVLESDLEKLLPTDPPLILSIQEELRRRSGESNLTFELSLPTKWQGIPVRFEESQVVVSVRRKLASRTERITGIPLRVLAPQEFIENEYELVWEDTRGAHFLQAIDVQIPVGQVEQPKANEILAFVIIEEADLPKDTMGTDEAETSGWITKEVVFKLPPGFDNVKIVSQPPTVKLRVIPEPPSDELLPERVP